MQYSLKRNFFTEILFASFFLIATIISVALYLKQYLFLGYFIAVIAAPFLVVALPIEPVMGIMFMVVATGFDFLATIERGVGGVVQYNLTYFQIALIVTFMSLLLNLILRKKITIPSMNLWFPLITLYIIFAVSLMYTPSFKEGIIYFIRALAMSLIVIVVMLSMNSKRKIDIVLWTMILVTTAIGTLTIYQIITGGAVFSSNVVKMATSVGLAVYRATGTFNNPNDLGVFLMAGIVVTYGLLFTDKPWPLRIMIIVLMGVMCGGILLSFSRAAWLATLTGFMLITAFQKKWSFYWIFLAVIALSIIFITVYQPLIWDAVMGRFTSIFNPAEDDSSSARISLIRSGIWMWQDHPLFGVGLRGFPQLYYQYLDPQMPLIQVIEAHTLQILLLAEEGLIGFTIATWLFATIFFHGFVTGKSLRTPFLRHIQFTMTALFFSYLVYFTFAADMLNNIFWMVVGLIYAIPVLDARLAAEAERVPDTPSDPQPASAAT